MADDGFIPHKNIFPSLLSFTFTTVTFNTNWEHNNFQSFYVLCSPSRGTISGVNLAHMQKYIFQAPAFHFLILTYLMTPLRLHQIPLSFSHGRKHILPKKFRTTNQRTFLKRSHVCLLLRCLCTTDEVPTQVLWLVLSGAKIHSDNKIHVQQQLSERAPFLIHSLAAMTHEPGKSKQNMTSVWLPRCNFTFLLLFATCNTQSSSGCHKRKTLSDSSPGINRILTFLHFPFNTFW